MAEYDAGSAFVSILPSTRGFAQRLKRELSAVHADIEVPVRPELDRRQLSGLQAALKALPAVVLDADATPADREIAQLRARLEALADQTVGIDISAADAHREVDSIRRDLDRLGRESPDIAVRVDAGAASAALGEVTAETTRLDGRTAKVKADADTGRALAGLGLVRSEAGRLDGRRIGLQVTADVAGAIVQLAGLAIAANQFANRSYSFQVTADTAGAVASIAKLVAIVSTLGGLAGIVGGLAGAIGGIGAAGAVAGAGLGAAVLGFLGVGKAVGALSAQQDASVSTSRQAAKQQEQHARQVAAAYDRVSDASTRASQARADGARNVERAEQQAAERVAEAQQSATRSIESAQKARDNAYRQAVSSINSAMQQQEAAQQRAARATRDLRQAQSELTTAWESGRRSLQDLQDQLDMSLIDQRQAAVDLRDARKQLDEARASGDTDAIERAQIAYDRQVESIDQLAKRTQRLGADNQNAQRQGVAGTDAYRAALDRVRSAREQDADAATAAADADLAVQKATGDARRSLAEADANIARARQDGAAAVAKAERSGAQSVADAREQADRSIMAADAAVVDAQKALTDALTQTGDAGSSAGDKVAAAFAGLSPEAARFARYLFGLKPILDMLSATAATALFPPLIAGIDTLLGRLPLINTVVGQLAGGVGAGLDLVLTELASPFWAAFFTLLGNAAGSIIPMLFASLMTLARAAATLITALMPIAPASLGILDALSQWISMLAGPLVQALAGMFPAVHAFIAALGFLGPLLVALSPILNVLGVVLSQILGAALQALIPILTALTPLIQVMAERFAGSLVAGIQAATPWLVSFAQWASANPGLVIGVISVLGGLLGALKPLAFVAGIVVSALHGFIVITIVRSLLTSLGLAGTVAGRALLFVLSPLNLLRTAMGFLPRLLPLIGQGLMFLGRALLTAMGPVGWLITAFGLLYTSSEPFRAAINQLLGVVMGLVGALTSAVMPIFNALSGVLSMLAGVVGGLVSQLAVALIPVINVLAGVLGQLVGSLLPPLMQIVGALVPVIAMLGQVFGGVLVAVLGPLVGALGQLIGAVLPPLIMILQSVVIPVIQLLAGLFAGVLAFVITNVLVPALQFLTPIIVWLAGILSTVLAWVITTLVVPALNLLVPIFRWIGAAATWLWQNVIVPVGAGLGVAFAAIGAAASWLWTNVLSPVFSFIGTAARVLFAVIMTVLITPLIIAWNLLAAAATWLWSSVISPIFTLIGTFIGWVWTALIRPALQALVVFWQVVLAPALSWLYNNIVLPIFNLIGAAIRFVWEWIIRPALQALVAFWQTILAPALSWLYNNIIKPIWDAIGAAIRWVWDNVIQPAFRAVVGGLDWLGQNFTRVVDWIRDIWNRLRGYTARPINFLVETVWNKGVVPAWNAVAGLVGLGPIKELGKIPENREGGRISGPGTSTSDSILGLDRRTGLATSWVSTDEYVVNAGITNRTTPFLNALNSGDPAALAAASSYQRQKYLAGYPVGRAPEMYASGGRVIPALAGGGPVTWQELQGTVLAAHPRARITDTLRPGAHDFHGAGKAIDIAGPRSMDMPFMLGVNRWIAQNFGGSAELIHTQPGAVNIKNGAGHAYSPAIQEGHRNHVHWANNGGKPGGFKGWISGVGESISTFFRDSVRDAFDKFTNPAIDALRGFVGPPPPAWRDAVPKLALKARDTVRDWVFGKADEKDAEASAGGGGGTMGPVGDGERFVIGQISDSARAHRVGFDGAVIGVATGIVESGLRNLNYGDRDSVGVFQQRGNGAWGSLEQRMNVRHAADMFFNKLVSFNWRAMPPGNAAQKVQASAFPARYGQEIGRARQLTQQYGGVFDAGGGAIGRGIMFKDVVAREEVLDPVETEHGYRPLTRIAADLEAGRLAPPQGLTGQQIAAMTPAQQPFPTEFELVGGELELVGDGLARLVDGRLRAVTTQLRTGRDT